MIKERNLSPELRAKIARAGVALSPNANFIYVDSDHAATGDARDGRNPNSPLSTVDAALTDGTSGIAATNGDVVVVMPGHSETLTAKITMDVAGVTVLCLGDGTAAPQFTINAAIDGIDMTAANCTWIGGYFPVSTAAATSTVNIAAANCRVAHATFNAGAPDVDMITLTAAGARPRIDHNTVIVAADGPDSFVKFEGVIDLPIIEDNVIVGSDGTNAYDDGVLDFNSVAVTNAVVRNNAFLGGGASTTVVANGGSVVGGSYGPNSYGGSATSADNVSADTEVLDQLSGATGVPTFPAAAIPANGVSIAELLAQVYAGIEGTAANMNGVAAWPAPATPAANVSLAEVLGQNYAALMGTAGNWDGIATYPAAALAANNVSIAEVLRAVQGLLQPAVNAGTSDIDDSVQDESTTWVVLCTITPAANSPLSDVKYIVDLDKASTGFGAVESTATIQFRIARKVDGTNWRGAQTGSPADQISATITGTNAAAGNSMVELNIGSVGVTEEVRIEFIMSADATADMELPDAVIYKTAITAPTITRVAAV